MRQTILQYGVETGHHELNLLLDKPGHGTTMAVDAWLEEILP